MTDAERAAINNIRASIEQMVEANRLLSESRAPQVLPPDDTDQRRQMTVDAWRRLGISGYMPPRGV